MREHLLMQACTVCALVLALAPFAYCSLPVPDKPQLHNWAGNVIFKAPHLRLPTDLERLQDFVHNAKNVREPLLYPTTSTSGTY